MGSENIHANNSPCREGGCILLAYLVLVQSRVSGENNLIVGVFYVIQCIKSVIEILGSPLATAKVYPLNTNSKRVFKFSGDGDVTRIFEYPYDTAAAMARPRAADLPLPSK